MDKCKYFFKDLVYVDFDYCKVAGEVQGHRIIKDGMILYKISNTSAYVPITMIHELTPEQKARYNEFSNYVGEWQNFYNNGMNREMYIDKMQEMIFNE